jgi:hypothetical protein
MNENMNVTDSKSVTEIVEPATEAAQFIPETATEKLAEATTEADQPVTEMTLVTKASTTETEAATTEAATTEVSTTEAATTEAATTETASTEATTTEVATTEVAATKVETTEVVTTEAATTEVATTEVAATEVATTEVATTKVETTEVAKTTSVETTGENAKHVAGTISFSGSNFQIYKRPLPRPTTGFYNTLSVEPGKFKGQVGPLGSSCYYKTATSSDYQYYKQKPENIKIGVMVNWIDERIYYEHQTTGHFREAVLMKTYHVSKYVTTITLNDDKSAGLQFKAQIDGHEIKLVLFRDSPTVSTSTVNYLEGSLMPGNIIIPIECGLKHTLTEKCKVRLMPGNKISLAEDVIFMVHENPEVKIVLPENYVLTLC